MAKTTITLTINVDIWELVKQKYPNQISGMVESYFEGLLHVEEVNIEKKEINEVDKLIESTSQDISKLKFKLDSLKAQREIKQKEWTDFQKKEIERKQGIVRAMRSSDYGVGNEN